MRIAVLSDIHGNADALEAVLRDVKRRSPDAIVNLGDCFSGPLDILRAHELLAGAGVTATVRGNHDRALLDPAAMDSWDKMSAPQVTEAMRDWIAALPATAVLDELFLCHATPQDDTGYWLDAYTGDGIARRADLVAIEAKAAGVPQRVMLCGHTHVARMLHLPGGRLIVNPGSIGSPGYVDDPPRGTRRVFSGSPAASYATLDRIGGRWTASLHLVPYDTGPAIALARATGADDWVQALETGWL
ncbi:MAG TPA: metallophosphoesterase family protein [Albidovulum sp.]|uniref:metallophosphoesterase family protein n=1 Tax=Albidovulum sp. TaxID=1872424 RepID=UPI002C52CCCE|nr:metallophosphoesterase family protein [Albidovulum sp.]